MNSKLLTLLLFMSFVSFGQTYSFSRKTVKVSVQTAKGNEYRTINTYQGPYKFVFETPRNENKLFTLLKPNESLSPGQPWYGFLKDAGYIEKEGILFKKSIYYFTESKEQVMLLISTDYSRIIIFNQDDSLWEFTN